MSIRLSTAVLSAALVAPLVILGAGCKNASKADSKSPAAPSAGALDPAYAAWKAGDFKGAYEKGKSVADSMHYGTAVRQEAAFVAGKSARKVGLRYEAIGLLSQAAESSDKKLRAQALAERGMAQCELEKFKEGAASLLAAADLLEGDELALAYFNAGIAEQKLNYWSEARTHLTLAVKYASNEALKADARRQIAVTGYTLQVGSFLDANAALRVSGEWRTKTETLRLAPPRVIKAKNAAGQEVYLVQVGQFTTFDSARSRQGQLGAGAAVVAPLWGE